jgi:predicted esterase
MSGGLIGTDEEVAGMPRTELGNMPIYIGSDMEDFHIPLERVKETARILKEHGADVELRIYTELGHTVHPEAVDFLQRIVSSF